MKKYYKHRIENAITFIDGNLTESISTTDIAQFSGFSTFHFHRIFKSITGESPYEHILRKRLEKGARMLKHGKRKIISQVAIQCGFSSIEPFSRQFKKRFGVSPSKFSCDKKIQNSKIDQINHEAGFYLAYTESRKLPSTDWKVDIIERQPIRIAVKRAVFGTDGTTLIKAYNELVNWGVENGIPVEKMVRYGMSIDDPEITPHPQYRYDFAIEKAEISVSVDGIQQDIIPGGKYAQLHVEGNITKVAQAWDYLYKTWLPSSDYIPRDYPAIEHFIQGPEKIGWETFNMNCLIPITKI